VRILFLITAPPPGVEGTDAVVQEAEALRSRFGGELTYLVPGSRLRTWLPRTLYGLHRLRSLERLDRQVDLHHIFHAELYPFPMLRVLSKPVVYTVVSGLGRRRIPPSHALDRLSAIAVPSQLDRERLIQQGVTQAHVVPAGVDASRFDVVPIAASEETFVLLAGSAPWTRGQFHSKGMDALLEVARRTPSLRLVLLWRGWLLEELHRRVDSMGLSDRVEILTERVDVNQVLRRVHAAVVLAEAAELVKAYPHSLLEALVCGRPVLVSDCIAMAGYVREAGCGRVVRGVSLSDLQERIQELRDDYAHHQENARQVGRRDFSQENVVKAYRKLYESALATDTQRADPRGEG